MNQRFMCLFSLHPGGHKENQFHPSPSASLYTTTGHSGYGRYTVGGHELSKRKTKHSPEMQLLFFDTFTHDSAVASSDINLDLVQFPSPVYVHEVRVIPLGARVSANFPGGVRLGATNPAKFDLEFFVNNLRASGASTFESLGLLKYSSSNGPIALQTSKAVATDGLVLRGHYSTITLAVYGRLSEGTPDRTGRPTTATATASNKSPAIGMEFRIKEEPVRPPESPQPDGSSRTLGESYAAAWTAKHSEQALKAEPPDGWPAAPPVHSWRQEPIENTDLTSRSGDYARLSIKTEPGVAEPVAVGAKGLDDYGRKVGASAASENNNFSLSDGIKKEVSEYYRGSVSPRGSLDTGLDRFKSSVTGDPVAGRYRSQSRDRSPGYPYARSRDGSLDRNRYRSSSREGSRERSREPHRRRSYEESLGDPYHPRSRDMSPERDRYRNSRDRSLERGGRFGGHGSSGRHSRNHSPVRSNYRSRSRSPRPYAGRGASRDRTMRSPIGGTGGYGRSPYGIGDSRSGRDYSPRDRSPLGRRRTRSPQVGGGREISPRDRINRGGGDYIRDRSPRAGDRDYDRHSLNSSDSRRLASPGRRSPPSPRAMRSLSPFPRSIKRSLSPLPRYKANHRSRSRSPPDYLLRRSRSPERWSRKSYSPPPLRNHNMTGSPIHRSLSRNGHRDAYSPPPPVRTLAATSSMTSLSGIAGNERRAVDEDILDNVSDISDGDIPEVPEAEEDDVAMELTLAASVSKPAINGGDSEPSATALNSGITSVATNGHENSNSLQVTHATTTVTVSSAHTRCTIVREDIEEISDEEAEWSDDIETAGYSDFEPMDGGEDGGVSAASMDSMIRIVDARDFGELKPLTALCSPIETTFSRVTRGIDLPSDRLVGDKAEILEQKPKEMAAAGFTDLLSRLSTLPGDISCSSGVIDDRWVDNVEALTALLQEELAQAAAATDPENLEVITQSLVHVALLGLDFRVAEGQPKPAYQVRHIKAGLRFLLEVLSCDNTTFDALIAAGVQERLLQLYRQRFITMPTRLLVLRVLDRTLDRVGGIAAGLRNSDAVDGSGGSVYEQLLILFQEETKTRIKFALTSTVNRFHLYETLVKLNECAAQLVEKVPDREAAEKEAEGLVRQLTVMYGSLASSLAHPMRFLPCSQPWDSDETQSVGGGCASRPEQSYFMLAEQTDLLAVLVALLAETATSEAVKAAIRHLLAVWLETEAGLLFLAAGCGVTIDLIQALIDTNGQKVCADSTSGVEEDILNSFHLTKDHIRTFLTSNIGLDLAVMMQAVQQLDILTAAARTATERQDLESRHVLETVQSLYGLTFTGIGRRAVVRVLTLGRHIEPLLALTRHSSAEGQKDMKKSAARGYANELLLLTVRSTDSVDFLTRYADELQHIGRHDEHSKLSELLGWAGPLANLTTRGIPTLVETIKKNLETGAPIPCPEVITCVRILKHLAIPPNRWMGDKTMSDEAKYNYALVSMFSQDIVSVYVSLLERLWEDHSQPHLHTATMVGYRGQLLLAILGPVLATLRRILEFLIAARDMEYRDLSSLGSILRAHSLLSVVPPSSPYFAEARAAVKDVLAILLSFTQPSLDPNKDDLGKSLWSEMMREVVVHASSAPCTYISGLQLLSELLPLPLPLPTARPLSKQEEASVLNCRKLWSAHLHSLGPELSALIAALAAHHELPGLGVLLRRTCHQLAGLSPPTAGMVATSVLASCHSCLQARASVVAARLMAFLAWLVSQPAVKAVVNALLQEEAARSEFCRSLELCFTQGSEACQASAIAALQSLCDPRLSLHNRRNSSAEEEEEGFAAQRLADSLPTKETLAEILTVLLNPFTCELRTNFSIQLLTVRTFLLLADLGGDAVFAVLRDCLAAKHRTLYSFLRKLTADFESAVAACLDCLEATIDFLAALLTPSRVAVAAETASAIPQRTLCLTAAELSWVVVWPLGGGMAAEAAADTTADLAERRRTHPLSVLQVKLTEALSDQEQHTENQEGGDGGGTRHQLQQIKARLDEVMSRLEAVNESLEGLEPLGAELATPLPRPSSLLLQWSWLPTTTTAGSLPYGALWPDVPTDASPAPEVGEEDEREPVDLLDIAARFLPDFELLAEARQVARENTLGVQRRKKPTAKKSAIETKALHTKNIISTFKAGGTVHLRTHHRGGGFGRSGGGGGGGGGGRPDAFRARPPNTSRPPSLHVDDFLVLELKGQQPTGPTGYNKQSIRAAKELFAQREAEAAAAGLKPPSQLREATREPVLSTFRGRGRGPERGGRGGNGGFRTSNGPRPGNNGGGFRRDARGWSPEGGGGGGFRTSEPRDLGREARPIPNRNEDRRSGGFRGGRGDRRGWDRGGGRGRDRGGSGGGGRGRDDRPRHGRNLTR